MSQINSPYPSSATSTRPTSIAHQNAPFSAPISQPQSQPSAPSPETLDILPALHELLSRTLPVVPGATNQAGGGQPAFPGQQSLDISQLPTEVSSVRARIKKARRAIEQLPDMDRTVEEQQEEIDFLRERISKQIAVIEGLKGKSTTTNGNVT